MSEQSGSKKWFSVLYTTRFKVFKGELPILNLSVLFAALAALSAPWVAIIGFVAALALGYRFSIEKNAPEFSQNFDEVIRDAAKNVKAAVDSVVEDSEKK